MGINLTEISQKVLDNNKNAANVFRKQYDLHYNPNPLDVPFEYIDEKGNKVTTKIPNVAKFRKRIWDDVGGALGQFNRTFYVDAENGDDNNDGSEDKPFKTIKKAIDSVPVGGAGTIFLKNGNYYVEYHTNTKNKHIYFRGEDKDNVIITHDYIDEEKKYFHSLQLLNTVLNFHTLTLKTSTKDRNDNRVISSLLGRANDGGFGAINIYDDVILDINKADLISQSFAGGKLDIYIYSSHINRNNDGVILNLEQAKTCATIAGVALQNGDVIGIVKDADSGNPINLLSNHNFSS